MKFQTYPSLGARALKLCQLTPAFTLRLLLVPDRVQNVIVIQTGEELIAAFPASFAGGAVRRDAAAVGGFRGVGGRGGPREPAHVDCYRK